MSITDDLPFPHHIPRETVASDFYPHPYGGIARDVCVTRDGFMRFFELDDHALSLCEAFPDGKVIDQFPGDAHELIGYIGTTRTTLTYTVTVVDRSWKTHDKFLDSVQAALEEVCPPRGIPRPEWDDVVFIDVP